MSVEWDLMGRIASASNEGKQDEVSAIIISNCLDGMGRAAKMALYCFELTDVNIKRYSDAAIILSKIKISESFREEIRQAILVDKLISLGLIEQ